MDIEIAEEVSHGKQKAGPEELAHRIEEDIGAEGNAAHPCDEQGCDREAEAHRYLGDKKDAVCVSVEDLFCLRDCGLGDAEELPEAYDEASSGMVADQVPQGVTDQIARHKHEIRGPKGEVVQAKEKAAQG